MLGRKNITVSIPRNGDGLDPINVSIFQKGINRDTLPHSPSPSGAGNPIKLSSAAVRKIQARTRTSYTLPSSLTRPQTSLNPQRLGFLHTREGDRERGGEGSHLINPAIRVQEGSHAPSPGAEPSGAPGPTVCILVQSQVDLLWKLLLSLHSASHRNSETPPGKVRCKLRIKFYWTPTWNIHSFNKYFACLLPRAKFWGVTRAHENNILFFLEGLKWRVRTLANKVNVVF